MTDNCHLLQKYTQTSQQLFCNFCRSVEHDENTCRSYELMMDWTPTYRVKTEMRALDLNVGIARARFQGCGQGRGGLGLRRGREQLICYNCGGLGHYACDCTNLIRTPCLYYTQFDHEAEDYPTLIVRLCKKGTLASSDSAAQRRPECKHSAQERYDH